MRALAIIFGVLLALLALFTGGCSLGFIGAALLEPDVSAPDIWSIAGPGFIATPFLILFAWMLMRTPASELDPEVAAQRMSVERFLGGVFCVMLALLMIGEALALQFFAGELDMGEVPLSRIAIYGIIGLAAIAGAMWCFRRKPAA